MKFMNQSFLAAIALVCLLAGSTAVLAENTEAQPPGNIAVVNGTPITMATFESELQAAMERLARSGQPPSGIQGMMLRQQIVESLINEELLFQESRKKKVQIPEAQLSTEYDSIKSRFPTETDFNKALEQRGMTDADLRDKLRRRMAIQKLVEDEIPQAFETSEADKQKFYAEHPDMFTRPESVRASHILIKLEPESDEKTTAEAQKKIEDVQKKLDAGGDFDEVAKAHSEGPSGPNGGDLGYFSRGKMVKPFEDAAFALKKGETSKVVRTDFGLHLIRVTDRKAKETVAYKDAEPDIGRMLSDEKRRTALESFVEGLRSQADIERTNG